MDSTPRRPSLPSFSVETSQEEWLFADFLEEDNVDDVEAMEIIDVESHERVQNGPLSNELFELTSFDVVPKPPCVETGEIAAGNDSCWNPLQLVRMNRSIANYLTSVSRHCLILFQKHPK